MAYKPDVRDCRRAAEARRMVALCDASGLSASRALIARAYAAKAAFSGSDWLAAPEFRRLSDGR